MSSDDGREPFSTTCYVLAAASDYLDGIAARITGQYSRLGALMDPLIDRLVVISGVVVMWNFELLPRWALAVLVAREVYMLVVVAAGLRLGLDLHINWIGRIAVWPTMGAVGRPSSAGRASTRCCCTSGSRARSPPACSTRATGCARVIWALRLKRTLSGLLTPPRPPELLPALPRILGKSAS